MTSSDAPDPRKVAEAALEAFVYVPVGLALEAKDLLPKLAQRGKNQIVLARLGARFVVQRAEAEAEKLLGRLPGAPPAPRPTGTPATVPPTPPNPASPRPAAAAEPPRAAGATHPRPAATAKAARPASPKAPRVVATPVARRAPRATKALAIPGYDTLSASQVVPRLDALRPAELEAIRRHETEHRGRRTILSRIAQLQA